MKRPPKYWHKAKRILCKRDAVLRKIIKKYNKGFLTTRKNPFFSLARTIVGQQVSVKSADSIWSKFEKKCKKHIAPKVVLKIPSRSLKSAGLSRQKISYLKIIAKAFKNKSFNVRDLKKMNDDKAINYITKLKGLGIWSAQMFLMFIKQVIHLVRNFLTKFLKCTLVIEVFLLGICGDLLIQRTLSIK